MHMTIKYSKKEVQDIMKAHLATLGYHMTHFTITTSYSDLDEMTCNVSHLKPTGVSVFSELNTDDTDTSKEN